MNKLVNRYSEKDLFVYFQQLRLLKAKELNDSHVERTTDVKEEKATFKGAMENLGRFFERNVRGFKDTAEEIDRNIEAFNKKNQMVISKEAAIDLVETLFKEDKNGLTKLLFSASIILDGEYHYKYDKECMAEVSKILYGDEKTLVEIRKEFIENVNEVSSKMLSGLQKTMVYEASAIGLVLAAIFASPILLGAASAGFLFGKLYNESRIKEEFKNSTPETTSIFLALQCTYIQRVKRILSKDEFKEELDAVLKNVNALKSDLDYYFYVENEDLAANREKIVSFHKFDTRLKRILELDK